MKKYLLVFGMALGLSKEVKADMIDFNVELSSYPIFAVELETSTAKHFGWSCSTCSSDGGVTYGHGYLRVDTFFDLTQEFKNLITQIVNRNKK